MISGLDQSATVERATMVQDPWGRQAVQSYAPVATIRCRTGWRKELRVDTAGASTLEDRLILITGTASDIQAGDRVPSVTDRSGNTVETGPLTVATVRRVATGRPSEHIVAELVRHG